MGFPSIGRSVDLLRREIQDLYKAGDALPPEGELAIRFNVNRHTLRRAIDELVNEGLVIRRHGSGVFVLSPTIDYCINAETRFTATLESKGKTTQSRVLRKQIILAKGGVASRLQVPVGEEVIFLETLREVDSKPFCVISPLSAISTGTPGPGRLQQRFTACLSRTAEQYQGTAK